MDTLTIRPVEYEDIADLDRSGRWKLFHFPISMHKAIVACDDQGALVGFCAFDAEERSREFRVYAIESQQLGAGRAMLRAIKERACIIIADSVLTGAQGWWERHGFIQFAPSDEEGTVGYFEWWREDEPLFAEVPLLPLWQQETVERIFLERQDQDRLAKAMQRMVKPNTLPMVSVPVAFVEAVRDAVSTGQITPKATAILLPFLSDTARFQSEPVRRLIIWYGETLMYLGSLEAPPELVDGLNELMREHLRQLERRGKYTE
jgi:hypothetical protein